MNNKAVVGGLIVLGVVARLIPHPWNATPVTAIALFGGTYLSKRWSVLLPLLILAFSDALLGWHRTMPFTWGSIALTSLLGWWVRRRATPGRILSGALAGSALFFVLTNFGVWVTESLYPRTLEGLWACYAAALPFFRATVLGDVVFTTVLFGAYALLATTALVRSPARSV